MKKFGSSVLLVCCAASLFIFSGCGKNGKTARGERITRVTVEKPAQRTFQRKIPVQGIVTPVEYAVISAKIAGTLELLKVDSGDRRKSGDLLFGIDRQVLTNQVVVKEDEIKVKQAALQSAEFAFKTAELSLHQAKLDYDRALRLKDSHAVSQAAFETAETSYKKAGMEVRNAEAAILNAKAQLKQSESNLTIAKKNLADSMIKAPFDCVVFETYVEENEYVSAGQKIMKLENHSKFEIICHISAVYYQDIRVGETAVEFLDASGSLRRAKVTYKAPGIDPASRTFEIKIEVPPENNVVSGMLSELVIILQEKRAYGIPVAATLLRANNRYIVYVAGADDRAESAEVVRGIIDGDHCEILNPEKILGKDVIVSGQTFINSGSLLKVVNR